ncbi:putative Inner membrane protein YjdF [Hypsibius exemplaris]|uniref:Inner membrane protein YjdF n=1 Tax=Hypsibius exemplaris TaxID=2072580 RepID=A0A1W0WYJ8_HYPEX|nr:putative Inner membrane protein YjdF [Hypsibius exemplaris]
MAAQLKVIKDGEPRILFGATVAATGLSLFGAESLKIWFMEAGPVLITLPLLALRYRKFRLTPLLYRLMFLHGLILLLGAHYTYAKVPLGFWVQRAFNLKRNNYDRLGHIFQGFVPAVLVREILLRKKVVRSEGIWLPGITIAICLAFSAYYELVEWFTAVVGGDENGDFMGSQGDAFDAQWDMLLALVGACCSLLFLGDLHDEQLARLADAEKKDKKH